MNRARNYNGNVGGVTDNGRTNGNGSLNGHMNGNGTLNGNDSLNGRINGNGSLNGNGGLNGNMNGRIFDNQTDRGQRLHGDLAEQIRALTFVKKELELYLDTHPDCRIALDYYYRTMQELKRLTEDYENTVGPLTSAGVISPNQWTWVRQPWPWQRDGDYMQPREDR